MQEYLEGATRAVQSGSRAVPFDDRLYVPETALIFLADQRGVAPERVQDLINAGFLRPQRWRGDLALYNFMRALERVTYIGALEEAGRLPAGVIRVVLAFEQEWEEALWQRLEATRRREFSELGDTSQEAVRIQIVQGVSVAERIARLREHVLQARALGGQAREAFREWLAGERATELAAPDVAEARRLFLGA